MCKRVGVLVVIGALVAAPVMGLAAEHSGKAMSSGALHTLSLTKDYTASPWTQEMGWGQRATGKLGFGVKNLLLGWTELFTEPKEAMDAGSNVFVGIGKGLKNAVEDELGGAVHLVTFPVTCLDAPLPQGGVALF